MNLINVKKKFVSKLNYLVILIFLTHGSLYLLFPNDVYNNNSLLKYIKYILIMFFTVLNLKSISPIKGYIFILCSAIAFVFTYYLNKDYTIIQYITYIFPTSLLIYKSNFYRKLKLYNITCIVVLIASIVGYIDFYFLRLFDRWLIGGSEYREISIFVNPNTMSLTISILCIYILYYFDKRFRRHNFFLEGLIIVNCIILNILSGSKTGLLLFIGSIILLYTLNGKYSKKDVIIRIILTFIICSIIYVILNGNVIYYINDKLFAGKQLRNFSLLSGQIRLSTNKIFLNLVNENLFFPFSRNSIGVDNMYFHLWGTFGILALFVFIFFNTYILYKSIKYKLYFYSIVIIFFLLSGVTTNFLYLWPLAYIYFYIIATFKSKLIYMEK